MIAPKTNHLEVPEMMEGSSCGVRGLEGLGGSGRVWEGPGGRRVWEGPGGPGRVGRVREGLGGSARVRESPG